MQTADFDVNAFNQSQQSEQDKTLLVKFFRKEVQDKAETAKEGRPIFKEVDYVDIKVPGSKNSGACHPVTGRDKARFPQHWDLYERRMDAPNEGTPLSEWPLITRTMVRELEFFNVKTVEQLANMTDSNLQNFHGGRDFQNKAKAYLAHSESTKAVEEKLALEKTLTTLTSENLELKTQMQSLMAKFEESEQPNEQAQAITQAVKTKAKAKAK